MFDHAHGVALFLDRQRALDLVQYLFDLGQHFAPLRIVEEFVQHLFDLAQAGQHFRSQHLDRLALLRLAIDIVDPLRRLAQRLAGPTDSRRAVIASARSEKFSGRRLMWFSVFSINSRLVAISMQIASPGRECAAWRAMPLSSRSSFDSDGAFSRLPASLKPCISCSKADAGLASPLARRSHMFLACARRSLAVLKASRLIWP
jgi:hypothetical protein